MSCRDSSLSLAPRLSLLSPRQLNHSPPSPLQLLCPQIAFFTLHDIRAHGGVSALEDHGDKHVHVVPFVYAPNLRERDLAEVRPGLGELVVSTRPTKATAITIFGIDGIDYGCSTINHALHWNKQSLFFGNISCNHHDHV